MQRSDFTRHQRFSSNQNITAALRMMSYGVLTDAINEMLARFDVSVMSCLENVFKVVYWCFTEEYL